MQTVTRRKSKLSLSALTLTLLIALAAACGSQPSSAPAQHAAVAPGAAGAPAHGTPAKPPALVHITMAEAVNAPAYSPIPLAIGGGIFAKHGLDVKAVPLGGGATASAALTGGSAQFDAGVGSDVMLADSKGDDLVEIATLANQVDFDLAVSKKYAAAHGITATSPLKARVAALRGASIGITSPGSATDVNLRLMLGAGGLKPSQFHEEALGAPTANLAALEAGSVDAAIFDPTFATIAREKGVAIVDLTASEFPQLAHITFECVLTTRSYAKAHPRITRAVAQSIAAANNLILDHPAQALKVLDKHFSTLPAAVLATSLPKYNFSRNAATTATDWLNAAKVLVENGQIPSSDLATVKSEFTNQYLPGGGGAS